ncbi:hypothetical protein D3C81_1186110 [compost metagenome]
MVRRPLQINAVGQLINQQSFTAAGIAADQHHRQFSALLQRGEQKIAQGLVTAGDARIGDAGLTQPLLHQLRTQTAAETVNIAFRPLGTLRQPGCRTLLTKPAINQAVAQRNRCLLALLFITGADGLPFVVIH